MKKLLTSFVNENSELFCGLYLGRIRFVSENKEMLRNFCGGGGGGGGGRGADITLTGSRML